MMIIGGSLAPLHFHLSFPLPVLSLNDDLFNWNHRIKCSCRVQKHANPTPAHAHCLSSSSVLIRGHSIWRGDLHPSIQLSIYPVRVIRTRAPCRWILWMSNYRFLHVLTLAHSTSTTRKSTISSVHISNAMKTQLGTSQPSNRSVANLPTNLEYTLQIHSKYY